MKQYTMQYTGEDKVAAALDDLLSFIHMVSLQENNCITPEDLKRSRSVQKALQVLKEVA